MQRAKVLTRANEQLHHMSDVFVRIIHDLAGRVVDIPTGEREAQCPPARFLQGALIHPWLEEEMGLRPAHGVLQP